MNLGYGETKRRWWSLLSADKSNGLLNQVTPPVDSLVICLQEGDFRKFSIFCPLYTFANEILRVKPADRCYYEVILGNKCQKPYFDIDINDKNVTEKQGLNFIKKIKRTILEDTRIKEEDILVFSSHGNDKLSYHIVVNNWCLPDFNSNKEYCSKIIERIPESEPLKCHIDNLVYKSIQQFRTFGSTKKDKDRFKVKVDKILNIHDKNYRFDFTKILLNSLVTNTNSCRILAYYIPVVKVWAGSSEDLTTNELTVVRKLSFIKDGTFDILEVKGRLIALKRKKPSFCQLCKRVHENENPYLTFSQDSSKIYIHCRRSSTDDKFLVWEEVSPGSKASDEPAAKPTASPKLSVKTDVKSISFLEKFFGKK